MVSLSIKPADNDGKNDQNCEPSRVNQSKAKIEPYANQLKTSLFGYIQNSIMLFYVKIYVNEIIFGRWWYFKGTSKLVHSTTSSLESASWLGPSLPAGCISILEQLLMKICNRDYYLVIWRLNGTKDIPMWAKRLSNLWKKTEIGKIKIIKTNPDHGKNKTTVEITGKHWVKMAAINQLNKKKRLA